MIDWEEIACTGDEDKLKSAKLWLFQENIRLENERRELDASRDKFLDERVRFRRDLEELIVARCRKGKGLRKKICSLKRKWQSCRTVSGSWKRIEKLWTNRKKSFPH